MNSKEGEAIIAQIRVLLKELLDTKMILSLDANLKSLSRDFKRAKEIESTATESDKVAYISAFKKSADSYLIRQLESLRNLEVAEVSDAIKALNKLQVYGVEYQIKQMISMLEAIEQTSQERLVQAILLLKSLVKGIAEP